MARARGSAHDVTKENRRARLYANPREAGRNTKMYLYDDDGECYEVDLADVEEDADGSGVWVCWDEDGVDEFFPYE